jgi:predicted RNase H-like HicB family nuclease
VALPHDGDAILATFPDVPEAITFGADETEALLQARDALETALSSTLVNGTIFRRPPQPMIKVDPRFQIVT